MTKGSLRLKLVFMISVLKCWDGIKLIVKSQNLHYWSNENQILRSWDVLLKFTGKNTCRYFCYFKCCWILPLILQSQEAEHLAMLSTELASKFLFTVGFHTKKSLRYVQQLSCEILYTLDKKETLEKHMFRFQCYSWCVYKSTCRYLCRGSTLVNGQGNSAITRTLFSLNFAFACIGPV